MNEQPKCQLCGEPMPAGEEVFKYHGFSGPCPAPPLSKQENEMTEGEYLVGKSFNPGGQDSVNEIKQKAADLIDCIGQHGVDPRTRALAITAVETGAMWGVKSATKPPREAETA